MALNSYGLGIVFRATDLATGQINRIRASFKALDLTTSKSEKLYKGSLKTLGAGVASAAAGVGILAGSFRMVQKVGTFDETINKFKVMTGNVNDAAFAANAAQVALNSATDKEFSPTEIAEGFVALNQAGLDAQKVFDTIDPTALFASASGGQLSVQQSAKLTGAFVKSGVAVEDLSDKLEQAAAFTRNSSIEFNELPRALGKVIGPAAVTSQSFDEVLAVLGAGGTIMGDFQSAATGLSNVMVWMGNKDKMAGLKAIGVNALDAEGNITDLRDIFLQLNEAQGKVSESDFITSISKSFGNKGGSKFVTSALQGINAVAREKGISFAEAFDEAIAANALGANKNLLSQLKTEMLENTITGQFKLMRGKLEALMISFGRPMADALLPIARRLNEIIDQVTSWSDSTKTAVSRFVAFTGIFLTVAGVAAIAASGIGLLLSALSPIAVTLASIATYVGPIGLLFETFRTGGQGASKLKSLIMDVGKAFQLVFLANMGDQEGFNDTFNTASDRAQEFYYTFTEGFKFAKKAFKDFFKGFREGIDPLINTLDFYLGKLADLGEWLITNMPKVAEFFGLTKEGASSFESIGKVIGTAVTALILWKTTAWAVNTAMWAGKGMVAGVNKAGQGINYIAKMGPGAARAMQLMGGAAGVVGAAIAGWQIGKKLDEWGRLSDTIAGVNRNVKTFRGLTGADKGINKDASMEDKQKAAAITKTFDLDSKRLATLRNQQNNSTLVGEGLFGGNEYGQRLGFVGAYNKRQEREREIAMIEARLRGLTTQRKDLRDRGVLTNDTTNSTLVGSASADLLVEGKDPEKEAATRKQGRENAKYMAEVIANVIGKQEIVVKVGEEEIGRASMAGNSSSAQRQGQPLGSNPEDM